MQKKRYVSAISDGISCLGTSKSVTKFLTSVINFYSFKNFKMLLFFAAFQFLIDISMKRKSNQLSILIINFYCFILGLNLILSKVFLCDDGGNVPKFSGRMLHISPRNIYMYNKNQLQRFYSTYSAPQV